MAHIAIPLADRFEDSEFKIPCQRLNDAGHDVTLFGTRVGRTVQGKQGEQSARIDKTAAELYPAEFDALLIPGGHAPDSLRTDQDVVSFVRGFFDPDDLDAFTEALLKRL